MDHKSKFQVERIALFSDAVFAIAITLMIIEVKPPHLHHDASNAAAFNELGKISPMLFGVVLSFIFIGLFWYRHHQLMKHMENYTTKLLMLNMFFLLTIVFLPFSTAFVFENVEVHSWVPMAWYNLNYIAAAFMNYLLFSYVLNPKNRIMAPDSTERIGDHRFELLYPIAVYSLVLLFAVFVSMQVAPMLYATFSLERVFNRKKKEPKKAAPVVSR